MPLLAQKFRKLWIVTPFRNTPIHPVSVAQENKDSISFNNISSNFFAYFLSNTLPLTSIFENHWKLLYATSDPKIDTVKEKNLVVDKHQQLKCSSFHYFQTSKKKCVYNLAFSNAKWLWWRSWAIYVWSECYDTSW